MNAARISRASLAPALLGAAAIAALAAVTEPAIRAGRAPVLRVLVHDASASCGARAVPAQDEIAALVDGLGSNDRVAVLSFGAHIGLSVGQCAPSELRTELARAAAGAPSAEPHGSSLFGTLVEAARSAARRPGAPEPGRRLEIVLATDGLATDRPETPFGNAVTMLRDAGCVSLRVLRRGSAALGSVVSELRGPGAARAGEPFSLEARGVARTDDATVELSDAAGVVETRRVVGAGAFRLAFTRIEEKTGPVAFTARIAAGAEIPPPVARVAVTSPGRALVVGAAPREIPGLDATWREARELQRDDTAAVFAAHDVVVLDDLPDASLDGLVPALREFVRRGGGVVLLGGAHSFGAGGWAGRGIETISPLVARPHDETGTFLYLALDGSGSMAEPWSDAAGAATRDAVVRGAAKALVASAARDTTLALRRFSWDLLPERSDAATFRLDDAGGAQALAALDGLPPPEGATALLPPLREASSLAAARGERRKAALVLTDGRTAEKADELHAALVALDAAKIRVTFVLPGDGALDDEARSLRDALAGTKAQVRGAATPEILAGTFREIEESARVDEPVVADRRLLADPGSAGLVDAVPGSAARVDRVWAAEGARQLVVTDRGEPVAAVRRVGLGTVAALATRPGDAEWLAAGDATSKLVTSLVRAAMRPASGRVRVERDGDARILVRYEPPPGTDAAAFAEFDAGGRRSPRVPLVPADGGLLSADLGAAAAGGEPPAWVSILAADGRALAGAGLDTPAPAEYRDPAPVDLDALAALAVSPDSGAATSLAPWLAAVAVALAVASIAASRVKSRGVQAR